MVLVRKLPYFQLFFLGNIGQENVFHDILERKNAFPCYKNKKIKKSKKWLFLKGLTHGFGAKMAIFPIVFLGNIGQENVFYNTVQRKNAFLGYKNRKFQQSKINIFLKGLTHGVGPKKAIFTSLFYMQYRPG